MKKLLFLIAVSLLAAGCVAVPVYDNGYYPYYGPYAYGYWGPDFVFVSGFHGHGHGHDGFHGRGGGFRGGGGFRSAGFSGGGFHGGGGGGRR